MARKMMWESITTAYARRVLRERGFETEDVGLSMRLADENGTGHMSTRSNGTHYARVVCQGAGEWDVYLIADPAPVADDDEPVCGTPFAHETGVCTCDTDEGTSPYVADPANPTDAELAAAIERGLESGQIIDAADFLAKAAGDTAEDAHARLDAAEDAVIRARVLSSDITAEYADAGHAYYAALQRADFGSAARTHNRHYAECKRGIRARVEAEMVAAGVIRVMSDGAWLYLDDTSRAAGTAPAQSQAGHCRVSGGFHRYSGATIHTTPTGAVYTLGGTVTCDYCHDVVRYHDLPREDAFAICRAVASTFIGPLSESFALWALEAYGVDEWDARMMLHHARTAGTGTTDAGLFTITVHRAGTDDHVGTTYTVERDVRTSERRPGNDRRMS